MPKAPRHRKRTRTARVDAAAAPGAASRAQALVLAQASPASEFATGSNGHQAHSKKVGKKEAEVANLLDKLKSIQVQERIWAAVRCLIPGPLPSQLVTDTKSFLVGPGVPLTVAAPRHAQAIAVQKLNWPLD